ncbi:hypothetical protein GCM10009576_098870 [Streptomyces rhizosphaericus]|uniref:Uncharacterized protein n=1 Tax=Streptomyces rhizosphaericus TaxID=114699 RepID=A0ABN1SX37_9ACTN
MAGRHLHDKWTHYTFSFLESRSARCAGSLQRSLRSLANPGSAVQGGGQAPALGHLLPAA